MTIVLGRGTFATKPPPAYSQAVKAAGLVFVSGTAPTDPATGAIKGTTLTNFRFEGANLNNYVGIADVDGDRIIFHKTGTGVPIDVTAPIAPDDGHLFGFGLGLIPLNFTLQGTYEVVAATGKYAKEFQIGDTFPFKSIATNPNFPPATIPQPPGSRIVPGTEYVEVYRNPKTRQ